MSHITNCLSFDVEHWHSATLVSDEVSNPHDRIQESIEIVLDCLRRHHVTATFFVVGQLARTHPGLLRRIAAAGHEIGSHGDSHTPLFDLTPATFATELSRSAAAIEAAIGRRPTGFRAPNFSVTPRTEWALRVLRDQGYRYDSSVFPVKTPMYGVSRAPVHPYVADTSAPFERASRPANGDLLEVPLAVFHPRLRLPMAGGFYARVLPERLVHRGISNLNRRGIPATLYFHPWEFNPSVPTREVSPLKRFVSFHGVDGLEARLERLLASFDFDAIEAVVPELDPSFSRQLTPHR